MIARALLPHLAGEAVLAVVERTLTAFDVKGPFRVQSLGKYGPSMNPNLWSASVSNAKGVRYDAYFDRDERLWALERHDFHPAFTRGAMPPTVASRVARWLASVHPRFPTRVLPSDYTGTGQRFEILVAGYPFVDVAYYYDFGVDHGAFTSYRVSDAVPPLGPSVPTIGRPAAIRSAQAASARFFSPGRVRYDVDPASARLAWLVASPMPPLRLAWCVTLRPTILGGAWSKSPSAFGLFFDAQTGQELQRAMLQQRP